MAWLMGCVSVFVSCPLPLFVLTWHDVKMALAYVAMMARNILVPSLLASLGTLSLGFLVDWVGKAQVSRPRDHEHRWNSTLIPLRWSEDDIANCEPVPFFTLMGIRALLGVGIAYGKLALIVFTVLGRNSGSLLMLAAGGLISWLLAMTRFFVYAQGIVEYSAGLEVALYGSQYALFFIIWLASMIFMGRKSLWPISRVTLVSALTYFFIDVVRRVLINPRGILVRLALLFGLMFWRGLALHVLSHAALQIPEAAEGTKVLLNTYFVAALTSNVALTQIYIESPREAFCSYMFWGASEVAKNSSMLKGFTEVEVSVATIRFMWRLVQSRIPSCCTTRCCKHMDASALDESSQVVPCDPVAPHQGPPLLNLTSGPPRLAWAEDVDRKNLTSSHDEAHSSPTMVNGATSTSPPVANMAARPLDAPAAEDDDEQHDSQSAGAVAGAVDDEMETTDEKARLLRATVAMSNMVEIVTHISAAVLILTAKVNPAKPNGSRIPWYKVLGNVSIALVCELLVDFSSVLLARGAHIFDAGDVNQFQRGSILAVVSNLVVIVATLSSFVRLLVYLCPSAEPSSTEFRSLSACPDG